MLGAPIAMLDVTTLILLVIFIVLVLRSSMIEFGSNLVQSGNLSGLPAGYDRLTHVPCSLGGMSLGSGMQQSNASAFSGGFGSGLGSGSLGAGGLVGANPTSSLGMSISSTYPR